MMLAVGVVKKVVVGWRLGKIREASRHRGWVTGSRDDEIASIPGNASGNFSFGLRAPVLAPWRCLQL